MQNKRNKRLNWRILLIPLSWLYTLAVWIRNGLFLSGLIHRTEFRIPIISVGNITAGGTGKTPHVEYLAELLKEQYRVATLSRGYKRKTRDFRIASDSSTAAEIGDEPLQIKQRFPDITVAVDRRRVRGVKRLMEEDPDLEVILLDDAYQHLAILPGLSILLIDFSRPLHKDRMLPAGLLREPARNRRRAQIILVTRSPGRMKPIERREYVKSMDLPMGQHLFFTTVRYGDLIPVYPGVSQRDRQWYRERKSAALMVTGIANPRPVRNYVRGITTRMKEICFPDHHHFTPKDLEKISDLYRELKKEWEQVLVLTTEKDAVRLRSLQPGEALRQDMHAVRIHMDFLNEDKQHFDQIITNYVVSNKRSSILYQGKDQKGT
ncbi:MAG TPA: tetraacyldisaccharide 4'-kinase [Bacteroides sp.]|nr:tetraacyldisaccharide 4'-kinase [Bacteroides sp.]